jgi:hypothetical protein
MPFFDINASLPIARTGKPWTSSGMFTRALSPVYFVTTAPSPD